ncbi:MAG: pyridoxamine 5'-phosphate oxidase [Desulfuromonas sp.]|uniref:pyridoxamine 5'-phosphate oxidase family protein n=1 Tax=Desulfuromonas sp. TaxID=892 RepID=UPI000CBACA7B|nr:pyridoxamine 5'-phosphate oxidase family protein [Desulfuromonas sp.]PLX85917.1 MAG: pyridoxamine 5'-phosphate oxidase [Desulfuromonas sp.]
MTREEILDFTRQHPVFQLATVEGGAPRVRSIMTAINDGRGLFFCTGRLKDMNRQLQNNPQVELCFFDPESNVQVRIEGEVEEMAEQGLKEEIVEKFAFLRPMVDQAGWGALSVYRLARGVANCWTMETNFAPKEFVEIF